MERPNRMALDLVDEAIDYADELRVGVRHLGNDAAVLDFGVAEPGGLEAGLLLAEVATGGLATVGTRVGTVDGNPLTHVELATDHPRLALAECQRPDWELTVDGATLDLGGPGQRLRADGPGEEEVDFAVVVAEAGKLPEAAAIEAVASAVGLPTAAVFALVAPANSVAGSVALAARAAERAVSRLGTTGNGPTDVVSVAASAPVAPLAPTRAEGRARSMAAIAGGARVHVVLDEPVERPAAIAEPSDDSAVVPAQTTLDVAGGPTHVVGGVDEPQVAADLGLCG